MQVIFCIKIWLQNAAAYNTAWRASEYRVFLFIFYPVLGLNKKIYRIQIQENTQQEKLQIRIFFTLKLVFKQSVNGYRVSSQQGPPPPSVPNCGVGFKRRGGLVKLCLKPEKSGSFLGQSLMKVEPNKVKWVVKFLQKWNLTHP